MNIRDLTECYAVPGENSIIDMIRPDGLTLYCGHTAEQIKARYPLAVRMTWDDFSSQMAARQNTPIAWEETTAERFEEMLNVLPPAAVAHNFAAFMVGEESDHDVATGRPRFQAYRHIGEKYQAASRPMTVKEFRAIV